VTKQSIPTATANTEQEKRQVNPAALGIAMNTIRRNAEREQSIIRDIQQQTETQNTQLRASQDALVGDLVSRTQEQSQSVALAVTVNSALSLNSLSRGPQSQEQSWRAEDTNTNSSATVSPTNNLMSNIQPRLPDTNTNNQSTGPTVNRNTPNNSLAGGVDIANMARNPVGFEQYMMGMADRPFYAPKEIYRGQRNVDNARAERFLNNSSEIRHQLMIEQQYNLGR
jgi:hypothetical protein